MRHLTSGQFVDLAEGTRDETSVPHLAACEVCRRQLADLRLMLASAGSSPVDDVDDVDNGNDVPEPSPLFWDHLSARVRNAVANEGAPRRASWLWSWPRVTIAGVAGAFAVALVALSVHVATPGLKITLGTKTPAVLPPPVAQLAPLEPLGSADDPSLSLVAEYGDTLDWDEMREQMAVATHTGGTEQTVTYLNGGERQELRKLLKEELARPGAQADRS